MELTREDLIERCETALELQRPENWLNRDSPSSFSKTATLLAYLKHAENPSFRIDEEMTDERVLWVRIDVEQMEFNDFDELYYLPRNERLEEAKEKDKDWY